VSIIGCCLSPGECTSRAESGRSGPPASNGSCISHISVTGMYQVALGSDSCTDRPFMQRSPPNTVAHHLQATPQGCEAGRNISRRRPLAPVVLASGWNHRARSPEIGRQYTQLRSGACDWPGPYLNLKEPADPTSYFDTGIWIPPAISWNGHKLVRFERSVSSQSVSSKTHQDGFIATLHTIQIMCSLTRCTPRCLSRQRYSAHTYKDQRDSLNGQSQTAEYRPSKLA
jgi:hypothetical protein